MEKVAKALNLRRPLVFRMDTGFGWRSLTAFSRRDRGISTIVAALLLAAVVVIASTLVYAWYAGILGRLMGEVPSVKEALLMDSYEWEEDKLIMYVRNIGDIDVKIDIFYIEEAGQAKHSGVPEVENNPIPVGSLVKVSITPGGGFSWVKGHSYTIKIVTTKGNQFTFPVTR